MSKMNERQFKQFSKWGMVFPRDILVPKKSQHKGYIYCPKCGEYFSINRVYDYAQHFEMEHLKRSILR